MHIDARTLENKSLIQGDICIVGAGAAGISMALEWVNTPYKVILLEGGGFNVEQKMQNLYKGKNTGQRYFPLESSRLHYFGGTTGHWAGFCSTFDPIDFKKRAWVEHSGWPIQRQDLDTYYEKAQPLLDLGPYKYDLDYWLKQSDDLVPLPLDEQVIWHKMWQFSPPTRFGRKYQDAIVKARNIHLYTYANVVNIETNDAVSSVKELKVKNLEGKEHTVRAPLFVMACSAIQNARLLLASNGQAQRGLGNDHDLVGRYFMEHLEVSSADLLMPSPVPMKLYLWSAFETKARAELAISEQQQEKHEILNGTASLTPLEVAKDRPAMIDSWPDTGEETVELWENMEKKFKEGERQKTAPSGYKDYQLFTRMEQSPNPSSRVTLQADKDALGMSRVALHWQLTPLEKRSIRKLYELIGQQVGLAGVGRVRLMEWLHDEHDDSWPAITGAGWHHMGTTRMHDNPEEGVVDANCKVHGIDNLYMAGSSCFPTAGAANPTLTLIALTLRLSDHLKKVIDE